MADPATAPAPAQTLKVTITEVPITADNPSGIEVDIDRFRVSKGNDITRLQVEWICGSSGFTVKFKGDSPFTDSEFSRTTPGSLCSGRVKDAVEPDDNLPDDQREHYEYSVRIDDRVLDPDGEVDP